MIVRIIAALKCDRDLGINAGAGLAREIFAGLEGEAIEAAGDVRREILTASVLSVSPCATAVQWLPSCFSNRTAMLAAGLPRTVSRTCVVILLMTATTFQGASA